MHFGMWYDNNNNNITSLAVWHGSMSINNYNEYKGSSEFVTMKSKDTRF